MTQALRCEQCSAPVTDDRWTNCPFCGAVLVKATINPLRAVVAPERFAAVERSPQFPALMGHQPSSTRHLVGSGFTTLFMVLFTLASGAVSVFALEAGPVAIVPFAMCCIGAVMLLGQLNSTAKFAKAKVQRVVTVWRDERTQVSGGSGDSAAVTHHYVLLETRNGRRQEFECSVELAGAHASGDIGLAFVRGDILLDFKRVDA
jgi:hypothetical protein